MAGARTRGTFSSRDSGISWFGFDALLKQLADAGAKVDKIAADIMEEAVKLPEKDMRDFMETGKTSSWTPQGEVKSHIRTGKTEEELGHRVIRGKKQITAVVGFEKNAGLPALFLDIGTPHQAPTFFVYYAFDNHKKEIRALQEKMLEEALAELKRGNPNGDKTIKG